MSLDLNGGRKPANKEQAARVAPIRWLQYRVASLAVSMVWLILLIISSALCEANIGLTTSSTSTTRTTTMRITSETATRPTTTMAPLPRRRPTNEVDNKEDGQQQQHCNDETEFSCQSDNNRCIPIEWRCDFTEQCSDGEDELGCLPEWCNFDHALCNWRSPHTAAKNVAGDFWRKYADASGSIAFRGTKRSALKKKPLTSEERDKPGLLQAQLGELREKLDRNTKFIFVPMTIEANRRDLALSDDSSKVNSQTKAAHLRAPLVSQTNSMCQLRFKYAMWIGVSGGAQDDARRLKNKLTLSLLARHRARGAPETAAQSDGGSTSIVWSRTIEHMTSPTAAAEWSIQVVELGHLEEIELEFEAKFTSLPYNWRAAEQSRSKTGEVNDSLIALLASDEHSQQRQPPLQSGTLSSLVALNWLQFQACAWPLGGYQDLLINHYQLDPPNEFGYTTPPRFQNDAPAADDDDDDNNDARVASCGAHQFQCSNDICLDEAKLCNFVDDCMYEDAFGAGIKGLDGALLGAEDELEILCKPVPGRVSFEIQDLGVRGLPMPGVPLRSTFWTLNSIGWPPDKIRVRNNLNQASHLPAQDHTLRSARGHYLSLEIPQLAVAQSRQQQIVSGIAGSGGYTMRAAKEPDKKNDQWIYLSSPWLKKLDTSSGSGDCRVKFFYNLVTDPTPTANDSPEDYLPFRIYLVVEHFVLERDAEKANQIAGISRRMDSFIFSQLLNSDNLILADRGNSIEYPGLDFWREVNYKLVDLKVGDIFYIRVAVIVEFNETTNSSRSRAGQARRATLNIDDLSTHFGCSLLNDQRMLNFTVGQYLDESLHLNNYLKSNRLSPIYEYMPGKRRQINLTQSIQFEPHKLIIYVMGALFSVFGVILLIVYVVVPYVERFAMSYHDRLAARISDFDSSTRGDSGSCELTTEADWESLSRLWRRPNLFSSTERGFAIENAAVTTLNS